MSSLLTRRHVITVAGQVCCGTALAAALGAGTWSRASADVGSIGPLQPADHNGIRLPEGFSSRIVARSLFPVADYTWHAFPDGGATFAQPDGGWIYVSNSESAASLSGGASAIRFSADGEITSAYRILAGTRQNCAGGLTPWGTWLSCEETTFGFVHECDPTGQSAARKLRALGAFKHEAAAVDPVYRHVYLTEDESDGCLYRFTPQSYPNLSLGKLEVASVDAATGSVSWQMVPHPDPTANPLRRLFPTRKQVSAATKFNGGEGIWYHSGTIYFSTKGDNRIWALDTHKQLLRVVYDFASSPMPVLRGVDNVTVSESGQILVAEDGGDMQLIALDGNGNAAPLLQVEGQSKSEITGPAFNPAGNRLYFSSQRGPLNDGQSKGVTYEVSGPFSQILQ
jgi:uncharacterized protein